MHQQFTGSMSRHHSVAMENGRHHQPPGGGHPPMPIRSSISGDRVNQITPPDTARDNFYQNLGAHSGGGGGQQNPGRNRIGGSQTSLTGYNNNNAPGGSNSSGAGARIARPASTHFMNAAASTPSIMLTEQQQQQQQQMMMMMSRSQSTASYVQQSPGPEKPSRQYSYEIHESDDNNTAANTIEKPRTVRFMETDASPVQEEEEDSDDPQLYEEAETPPPPLPPATETVSGPGTARLDMLLNSNSSSSSNITSSPPKRVSFQSSEQQSVVVTSATNTTNNESKSVEYSRESTKTSSRVSFRDQYLNQPSFTSRGEEEENNCEGGEEDNLNEENVDDRNELYEEEEDNRVHRMSRDQDPNTFIREAESLLNDATIGVRDLGIQQAAPPGISVSAGGADGVASSKGGVTTHTPSVIGTQEVYRDPRQRRLTQQQQVSETEFPI